MVATSLPLSHLSDETLVAALTHAHGHVALTAERLDVSPTLLFERLPLLPYDLLTSSIKAARLLRSFDAFTVMQDVVFKTLEELSPNERAKFFLQFMDRFQTMVEPPASPPVQGQNSQQINFNLGSPEAVEDARTALAKRFIDIGSGPVRDIQANEPAGQAQLAAGLADPPSVPIALRLGADGAARTVRAINSLDDMAPTDG